MNTRDQVSLVSKESNYRPCPVSWKGPLHEKCIVDKVQVTSELQPTLRLDPHVHHSIKQVLQTCKVVLCCKGCLGFYFGFCWLGRKAERALHEKCIVDKVQVTSE
jgi:hypothetical protein